MHAFLPLTESLTAIVLLTIMIGYFFGAIPSGLLLGNFWLKQDIRHIGSGNIGATNMLRTGNILAALVTLGLDIAKGAIPCLLFYAISPPELASELALLAGLAAMIGHMYPVWLDFKGGKGVATTIGIVLALHPPLGVIFVGLWLVIAALMHFSSLASLIAVLSLPVTAVIMGYSSSALFGYLFVTAMIFARHRSNIVRLLAGEEPRIAVLDVFMNTTAMPTMQHETHAQTYQTASTNVAHSDIAQSKDNIPHLQAEARQMATENDWDDITPPPELLSPTPEASENPLYTFSHRFNDAQPGSLEPAAVLEPATAEPIEQTSAAEPSVTGLAQQADDSSRAPSLHVPRFNHD